MIKKKKTKIINIMFVLSRIVLMVQLQFLYIVKM